MSLYNEFLMTLNRVKASTLPSASKATADLGSGITFGQESAAYLKRIMTMRSARMGKLNDVDIFAELFAQFMVTG